MDRPKYWAFLSYSHRDTAWANWLHKALESYRPPRQMVGSRGARGTVPARLAPVFRDREELASATDLGAEIRAALENSHCQIVICSPNSARSRWVNEEILAFKRLGRADSIFCLVVDGEPNASDDPAQATLECFPPALRFRLDADGNLGSERTEPIAADARPGKDGRGNALLKLVAGVLGVGFDTLKRREQRRRQQRLLVITAAAITGMVITSGLATYALIARAAAQRATARAEAEAATAQQTTSFLVDLFRVSDPSEARGAQVTAREVLDKGAARVRTELVTQPAVQARLLDTIGTVYMGLGLYSEARPLLDDALQTRRRLPTGDGSLGLAGSLDHLGDLQALQAQYQEGERSYREAIAALRGAPPGDRRAAAQVAHSLFGLGTLLAQQGRYDAAEDALRDALGRQQKLYGATHADIARTLQSLAKTIDQNGNLKRAVPLMQAALAMQRKLSGALPHPALAEMLNDMGALYEEAGEYGEATALLDEALAMKRRLLGDRHPEIATAYNNLAFVQQDAGQLEKAEANYRQALAMRRELLGKTHPEVAATLNNLAFVQYDRGDTRGALRTEREALAILRAQFKGDHPDVASLMNRIGYWLTEAGDYAEADTMLEDALTMRQRLVGAMHPDVAGSLTHLAILEVARHHPSRALELAQRAIDIDTAAFSASHWRTAVAQSAAGAALDGLGRRAEAERQLVRSYEILSADSGALPTYRALAQRYLRTLYGHWGNPPQTPLFAFLAGSAVVALPTSGATASAP